MTLTTNIDITSYTNSKVVYAKKGDKIKLITDSHCPVLICSINDKKFPVHESKTDYKLNDKRSN